MSLSFFPILMGRSRLQAKIVVWAEWYPHCSSCWENQRRNVLEIALWGLTTRIFKKWGSWSTKDVSINVPGMECLFSEHTLRSLWHICAFFILPSLFLCAVFWLKLFFWHPFSSNFLVSVQRWDKAAPRSWLQIAVLYFRRQYLQTFVWLQALILFGCNQHANIRFYCVVKDTEVSIKPHWENKFF